jgi:ribonuclease D
MLTCKTVPGSETSDVLVSTPAALAEMMAHLSSQPSLAFDTEADSFHSYFEKTCLIQIASVQREFVVDPLALGDLSVLGSIFASPRIEKVFHAAEYDVLILRRDYGFTFVNIFDTMVATKVLGYKRVGLSSLAQDMLGVTLDKGFQRADWSRRPLQPELITYARQDVRYLLKLRQMLGEQLAQKGRLAQAEEEFARLTQVTWTKRAFDPEGYQNLKEAEFLDSGSRAVLRELYLARDAEAQRRDLPVFRIMSDALLIGLSQRRPTTALDLNRLQLPGLTPLVVSRHSTWILAAMRLGKDAPPQPLRRVHTGRRRDDAERDRFEALRRWRKEQADREGVEPEVVVPRQALTALAQQPPVTMEELAATSGLGPWTVEHYGEQILNVLNEGRA